MSSAYYVQLQRIYGVPSSENVGYQHSDLNIGNKCVLHAPGLDVSIEVSSTASSTDLNNLVNIGADINNSTLQNERGAVCREIGLITRNQFQ